MSHEEMSFCELRNKEIVNEIDGRRLGKTCDLIFSLRTGQVLGIVAPFNKRGLFFKGQEVFVPFKHISKIGPDVILVRLTAELSQPDSCVHMSKNERPSRYESRTSAAREDEPRASVKRRQNDWEYYGEEQSGPARQNAVNTNAAEDKSEEGGSVPDCDFRCEKCMLFDCNKRWKGNARQKKHSHSAFADEGGREYAGAKL